MAGLSPIGKSVSLVLAEMSVSSIADNCTASSMIATGLSWRMAIGALVLGNAIMGMVITINGRIGARASLSMNVLLRIMTYIS